VINVSGADSGHLVETATVLVVGTAMPGDSAPIEEQVRVLISRVEGVERQAQADRLHHAEDIQALRTELTAATRRHEQANDRLEEMTRWVAISTVKLQLLGPMPLSLKMIKSVTSDYVECADVRREGRRSTHRWDQPRSTTWRSPKAVQDQH
jgi:outer membrane murein-binding lipoprotein Lpp